MISLAKCFFFTIAEIVNFGFHKIKNRREKYKASFITTINLERGKKKFDIKLWPIFVYCYYHIYLLFTRTFSLPEI